MSASPSEYGKAETLFATYPPPNGAHHHLHHLHPHAHSHPHALPPLTPPDLSAGATAAAAAAASMRMLVDSPHHRLNGFNHHSIDGILGTPRRPQAIFKGELVISDL